MYGCVCAQISCLILQSSNISTVLKPCRNSSMWEHFKQEGRWRCWSQGKKEEKRGVKERQWVNIEEGTFVAWPGLLERRAIVGNPGLGRISWVLMWARGEHPGLGMNSQVIVEWSDGDGSGAGSGFGPHHKCANTNWRVRSTWWPWCWWWFYWWSTWPWSPWWWWWSTWWPWPLSMQRESVLLLKSSIITKSYFYGGGL